MTRNHPNGAPHPHAVTTPGWTLELESTAGGPEQTIHSSLLSLSSGTTGVRGGLGHASGAPGGAVLAAGAYGRAADGLIRPLLGPPVADLGPEDGRARHRGILDLRDGTLTREPIDGRLRAVRFVSLVRPGLIAIRAEDDRAREAWPPPLGTPPAPTPLTAEHTFATGTDAASSTVWAQTRSDRAVVDAVATQRLWRSEDRDRLERLVVVRAGSSSGRDAACEQLERATQTGFDALLDEHREEWTRRWRHADIEIVGDERAQLGIRYALFHLLSCAPTSGEAAVGARGLTGLAYAGHVFWDTDVFVLPALAATLPDAARTILEYRIRRLPAARARAHARGLAGALFPWESADSGADVTPTETRDVEGNVIEILTGRHAEHINSDVAWAAQCYADWTGDVDLLTDEGRGLVVETARYWASRIRIDERDGSGHIEGVIGPDEYHEVVDDNSYTNVLARWHLRRAAVVLENGGDEGEAKTLRSLAERLTDGFDGSTGGHEQFRGFWELEPLEISNVGEPPFAADLLLGRDRTMRSRVIKQPDVLMAHHLVPEELAAGSLAVDLDTYLPLTAHGSSLSPAICAALLARAGRPDDAMTLFDLATRLDLDDLTGTTAGGLHLATMGGLWQAVVFGFAGIRPRPDGLEISPHLPTRWSSVTIRLQFRGHPVRVTIDHQRVSVESPEPVPVVVRGRVVQAPTTFPIHRREEAS